MPAASISMRPAQRKTLNSATRPRISRMRARCSSFGHLERRLQRRRAFVGVVGVDDDRFGELARRARELAQHQHAALVVARRDEFLRHQVHPVVQAADHADFGGAIVLVHGLRLVVRGQQDDRRMAAASANRALMRVGQRAHARLIVVVFLDAARASARRSE